MVEIFSKQDGVRQQDAQVRRLIAENRGVITKLADQISGGRYSQSKQPKVAPQVEGLIIHVGGSAPAAPLPEPKIRVTTNGRVISVDVSSGRQLLHLGDIRERNGTRVFSLAIKANGYIAPLDAMMAEALDDFDGIALGPSYDHRGLATDLGLRLDIPPEI
jgi:hypothetical protein